MTEYNPEIDIEAVGSKKAAQKIPPKRHSNHEQPRHVKRDAKSGCSVEKDRLVGECNIGCQSGGVRSIDIRSNVRARWRRIGALYIDRSDECVKVA